MLNEKPKLPRDYQRTWLYRAEQDAFNFIDTTKAPGFKDKKFRTLDSIRKRAEQVRTSSFTKTQWSEYKDSNILIKGKKGLVATAYCQYYGEYSIITLPYNSKWARRDLVLLHEIAHHYGGEELYTHSAHGPEFVSRLVALVGEFVSPQTAEVYRKYLTQNKVNIL